MPDLLPDCMMPDGADPCQGYVETHAKMLRYKAELACLRAALKEAQHPPWISVEERLPENFVSCLIGKPGGPVMAAFRYRNEWLADVMRLALHGVTHWMPLPAPPGERGE